MSQIKVQGHTRGNVSSAMPTVASRPELESTSTSMSSHANWTRATVPHSQSTIALYTELDIDCEQSAVFGRRL